jgi:hypothetical protein
LNCIWTSWRQVFFQWIRQWRHVMIILRQEILHSLGKRFSALYDLVCQ